MTLTSTQPRFSSGSRLQDPGVALRGIECFAEHESCVAFIPSHLFCRFNHNTQQTPGTSVMHTAQRTRIDYKYSAAKATYPTVIETDQSDISDIGWKLPTRPGKPEKFVNIRAWRNHRCVVGLVLHRNRNISSGKSHVMNEYPIIHPSMEQLNTALSYQ